jgi:hypothetical protein
MGNDVGPCTDVSIAAAVQAALLTMLYLRYDLVTLFCAVFAAESWLILYKPERHPLFIPSAFAGPGEYLALLPLAHSWRR